LLCGRLFQHGAGRGAGSAHGHEVVAERARAVRVLIAEASLIADGLRHPHLGPIGFELVGDDHRDRGPDPLAHLGAVAGDGHDPVLADRNEDLGVVAPAVRHAVGAELLLRRALRARQVGKSHREDEGAEAGPREEAAAADIGDAQVGHSRTPFAACLIAARMRG
jgi:hypothetical protein